MIIDENAVYSIKEASDLTGVNARTITRFAVKLGVEKIDNRYILKGIDLIEYLKKNEIEVTNYDDILKELDTTRTQNLRLSKQVKILSESVKTLSEENKELNTIIAEKDLTYAKKRDEAHRLKRELMEKVDYMQSEIPHKEKLKEAIRLITLEAMEQGVTHKVFTEEEYNDIIGTISEVDFQTKQVEYLKGRVEKQDEMLQDISAQIRQRNFIEAKDKGHHKTNS
jgi:hypothetical protein